ncbi:hypothetical protein Zm00014a_003524 [Zea mays]|uniref:Uncharacterized protein n=1 Tax=Zea mays TaxID=4577 RepID=A0A317YAM2_MAIZE|nr:hypothetical protein Zm00014a_003524 [Zea mays]
MCHIKCLNSYYKY